MVDLGPLLSPLTDRPLADSPPVEEIERRARRLRRRRWTGRGVGATTALVVLVAGAVALAGDGGRPTTVRTAAPVGSAGGDAGFAAPHGSREFAGMVRVDEFEVDGQRWMLLAGSGTSDNNVCLELRTDGVDPVPAGCWNLPVQALEAVVTDVKTFLFVSGLVAKDVSDVRVAVPSVADTHPAVRDAALPVNVFGAVVPLSTESVDVIASTAAGVEHRLSFPTPVHRRVASINGEPAPPVPGRSGPPVSEVPRTTIGTTPPTTVSPDTPASTVVPPTTVPPSGGMTPTRVDVVPGATQLRKQPFVSATASGSQSVAVRFWGGVAPCDVLARVDVAESASAVTITLWAGTAPGAENAACIMLAQYKEVIVTLDAPLGDRTVVDGAA